MIILNSNFQLLNGIHKEFEYSIAMLCIKVAIFNNKIFGISLILEALHIMIRASTISVKRTLYKFFNRIKTFFKSFQLNKYLFWSFIQKFTWKTAIVILLHQCFERFLLRSINDYVTYIITYVTYVGNNVCNVIM